MVPRFVALAVWSLAGCPSPRPASGEPPATPSSSALHVSASQSIDLAVLSGREQPPPIDVSVAAGTSIVLRVRGLGPPSVVVRSGAGPVATTESALNENGSVTGTEVHFVASAPGVYDVVNAGAGGAELAHIAVR